MDVIVRAGKVLLQAELEPNGLASFPHHIFPTAQGIWWDWEHLFSPALWSLDLSVADPQVCSWGSHKYRFYGLLETVNETAFT